MWFAFGQYSLLFIYKHNFLLEIGKEDYLYETSLFSLLFLMIMQIQIKIISSIYSCVLPIITRVKMYAEYPLRKMNFVL